MTLSLLALVAAIFALAGIVKGVVGLGLPTVAMGLLGLMMAPVEAAALLILPSMVTNLWQLFAGPRLGPIVRRLWPTMAALFVATVAASGLIAGANARLAAAGLGAALLLYAILGLLQFKMQVPARIEPWAGPLVGAATGIVTGATGVFTVPAVPYLGGLGFARDDLVQALGLSFTVSTLGLAAGLFLHGAYRLDAAGPSIAATLAALVGMAIGGVLRQRLDPATFRRWFFAGLAMLGIQLLLQNSL